MNQLPINSYSVHEKIQHLSNLYLSELSISKYCKLNNVKPVTLRIWRSEFVRDARVSLSIYPLNIIYKVFLVRERSKKVALSEKLTLLKQKTNRLIGSRERYRAQITQVISELSQLRSYMVREQIEIIFKKKYPAREKMLIIKLVENSTLCRKHALQILGLSRQTYRRWLTAFNKGGEAALEAKIPIYGMYTLPNPIAEFILCLRHQYPYITAPVASDILAYTVGYFVSASTIQGLLLKHKLYPMKTKTKLMREYEKIIHGDFVNHVWLSDFSELLTINGSRKFLLTVMDDYSRYIIKWAMTTSQTGQDIVKILGNAFDSEKHNIKVPVIFNVDNGPCYRSKILSNYCDRVGINKHHGEPYNWNGRIRIEAFHGILKRAMRAKQLHNEEDLHQFLDEYIWYYNEQKPHTSLSGSTPFETYYNISMNRKSQHDEIKTKSFNYRKIINRMN